jgi:trehalose synthase
MHEVPVLARPADRLRSIAGAEAGRRFEELLHAARDRLRGRTVWHVNSTAEGGGVAELLRSTLGYLANDGIRVRWLVIDGDPAFFAITKRIHNRLHGELGDGGPLAGAERDHLREIAHANVEAATTLVQPGDVVVVHDPQPLGLVPDLRAAGASVIWTCHVGVDAANDITRSAWAFLEEDARAADAATFTRRAYVWDGLGDLRTAVIPPCIDPESRKNVALDQVDVSAILAAAGVTDAAPGVAASFTREDGTSAPIVHRAQITEDSAAPAEAPFVVQVSRWDALKDPAGVIRGFAEDPDLDDAHLMLAGPAPSSVADDPEATDVFRDTASVRAGLPERARGRIHLANLPTDDVEENAIIVNALQRRADVVVQKSLAEGFGLTVTEAMWKERPLVAAHVGGIQDQIDDGINGLLVDPRDLVGYGNAVQSLLEDRERADSLGRAAGRSVRARYLPPQYLGAYLELFATLD